MKFIRSLIDFFNRYNIGKNESIESLPIEESQDNSSGSTNYWAIKMPNYKSQLELHNNLYMHFENEKPNIWWRMWQWLLLGWKWTDINGQK